MSFLTAKPNFGAIEINWDASPPRVKIELRDEDGNSINEVSFLLSELQANDVARSREPAIGYQQHCTLETDLPWLLRKRLALVLWAVVGGMFVSFYFFLIFFGARYYNHKRNKQTCHFWGIILIISI